MTITKKVKKVRGEKKYKEILGLLRANFDHTRMLLDDDKLYGKGEQTIKCEMIARIIVNEFL